MIHSSSSSSIGSSSQRSTSGGVSRSSRGSGSTTTDAPSTTSGSTRIASSQSRIVDQEDLHPNAAADLMLHAMATAASKMSAQHIIDKMASEMGLDANDTQVFKQAFQQHMAGLDFDKLTPGEKSALDAITARITQEAQNIPSDRSQAAQFRNSTKTATIAWATGFGLVSLITKIAQHTGVANPIYLTNLAGPLILLVAEILAGKYRAEGAGYPAMDNAAYLNYSEHISAIANAKASFDAQTACATPTIEQTEELAKACSPYRIKIQGVVADLIVRELGHALGLKSPDNVADVPLQCLRSGLTADRTSGEVRLPDGQLLFTVLPGATRKNLQVAWPPDGTVTNLLADPVPEECKGRFATAESKLLDAARLRSFITDETPFLLFGAWYTISGSLGPYLLASMDNKPAAAVLDTVLAVSMAFFGTQSLMHAQNGARSSITGVDVSPGLYKPHREAQHELAKLSELGLSARLAVMNDARKQLKQQLTQAPPHSELANEIKDALVLLKQKIKQSLREQAAAEALVQKSGSKLAAVAIGHREALTKYASTHKAQLAAKVIGYSTTYLFYSLVFMQAIQLLTPQGGGLFDNRPDSPVPPNGTDLVTLPGNQTMAPEASVLAEWGNYMAANAFNGFCMAGTFLFRNFAIARGLEYGFNWLDGAAKGLDKRWAHQEADSDNDSDSDGEVHSHATDQVARVPTTVRQWAGGGYGDEPEDSRSQPRLNIDTDPSSSSDSATSPV
jgi:hypothetical protein